MVNRARNSGRGWRFRRSAALLAVVCLTAVPLQTQEAEGPAPPPSSTGDVPYAVVAEALLAGLVQRNEAGVIDGWARTHGLEPGSAPVQELLALALDLERQHPRAVETEAREEVLQQFAGDEEGLRTWAQRRRVERFRAAGEMLGAWLEARKAEGYPPEFLIERLLSRQVALVARSFRALPREHRAELPSFQSEVEAFERGLETVMGPVPQRFRSASGVDH